MDVLNAINFYHVAKKPAKDPEHHKEMAKLYYNLYVGCLKFREDENKNINCDTFFTYDKNINCDTYLTHFKLHTQEYFSILENK